MQMQATSRGEGETETDGESSQTRDEAGGEKIYSRGNNAMQFGSRKAIVSVHSSVRAVRESKGRRWINRES
jgi:hypothetical protein